MMMTTTTSRAILAAGIALLLFPVTARAQPSGVDEARRHADAGQAALAANDFGRALDEYNEAYRLFPNSLLLVNVARAESGLGRNREAIATLQRVLADTAVEAERKREVEAEVQRLRGLVAEITIAVTPSGARVRVNGQDVENPNEPLLVNPGRVEVEATLEGYRPGRWEGELAAGGRRPVPIALERESATAGGEGEGEGEGEIVAPPPGGERQGGGSSALLWVTGVGAGVLGAAALTVGAIVWGKNSDYEDSPPADPQEREDARLEGKTLGVLADVLAGVAVVSAGIFVVLLVTSGDAEEAAATALAEPGVLRF